MTARSDRDTTRAVYGLGRHDANNDTEYGPEHVRGWRLATTVSLVCMIALAAWSVSRGNLL